MGITRYKIINEQKKIGVWFDTSDLIQLIKLCDKRNQTYKKKLIDIYEKLEEQKFNEEWIKKK